MHKKVEIIECHDDSGEKWIVEVWQEMVPAGHMGNPNATVPGMKVLRLQNGGDVIRIDNDTFETRAGGVKLTRS